MLISVARNQHTSRLALPVRFHTHYLFAKTKTFCAATNPTDRLLRIRIAKNGALRAHCLSLCYI